MAVDEAGEVGIGEEEIGWEGAGEEERNFRFMMMRVILNLVLDGFNRCLRKTV